MAEYEFHEACLLLPEMDPAEIDELAEDMRKHGQLEAIDTFQGIILDGRSRLAACKKAELEPVFREWDGRDANGAPCSPYEYVASKNLRRRNIPRDKRIALGLKLLEGYEREARERSLANLKQGNASPNVPTGAIGKSSGNNGSSVERAASKVGVPPRSLARASRLNKQATPQVKKQALQDGTMSLGAAEQTLKQEPQESAPNNDKSPDVDKAKTQIPEKLKKAFAARGDFDSALAIHREYLSAIRKLAKAPGGELLVKNLQQVEDHLANARRILTFAKPLFICPDCKASGESCEWCHQLGWVGQDTYDRASAALNGGKK